jgi:hypothetical protein
MSLFYSHVPSETLFFRKKILSGDLQIDKKFHISMDKELIAHIFYSGYKFEKVDSYFAHFRVHENNKSKNTKEVRAIKRKEGLTIYNRYSQFKFPENYIGYSLYWITGHFCTAYRAVSRMFNIWLYNKKECA